MTEHRNERSVIVPCGCSDYPIPEDRPQQIKAFWEVHRRCPALAPVRFLVVRRSSFATLARAFCGKKVLGEERTKAIVEYCSKIAEREGVFPAVKKLLFSR